MTGTMKTLGALVAVLALTTGCLQRGDRCDGLDSDRLPGRLVIVERMDEATYYVLPEDDPRLAPVPRIPYVSCQGLDLLGRLEQADFAFTFVGETDVSGSNPLQCMYYYFDALDEDRGLRTFSGRVGSDPVLLERFVWLTGPDLSTFGLPEWAPSPARARWVSELVVSQLATTPERYRGSRQLRPDEEIYDQGERGGPPPLIIVRSHRIVRCSDCDDAGFEQIFDYLDVPHPSPGGSVVCADLFFGYFER